MNYCLLITAVLGAVCGISLLTRQLQMLQQNSYFPSRYILWVKDNFSYISVFAFCISSVLLLFKLYLAETVFLAFCAICSFINSKNLQKKSIKKLVFTGRVKRLYSAAIIIFLILTVIFLGLDNVISMVALEILLLFAFISPMLALICWAVTLPIEKAFAKWYINDAKKILKNHKNLKIIGITGSYGKTTTKFILTRILSEKYNTVCTPQSFNTPMGVVRTIREKLKPQTEIFVCEMGAKNVGDIKEICDIVHPQFAMITSVGAQHLETFKTIDNVYNTKFELADAVSLSENVFINGDSKEIINRIGKDCDYNIYGTNIAYDFSYGRDGSKFKIRLGEEELTLTSKLLGLHSIINITGAVTLAYKLGVSAEDIKYAVASLKPTEHRLEMKPYLNNSIMIDDAYNANAEGSIEAVNVLGSFEGMKKIVITPGLIELGSKEYDCNYALGLECAKICDIIIFVGKNRSKPMVDAVNTTEFNKQNMFVASSFKEASEIYSRFADSKTVVLIENDLPDNYLN